MYVGGLTVAPPSCSLQTQERMWFYSLAHLRKAGKFKCYFEKHTTGITPGQGHMTGQPIFVK